MSRIEFRSKAPKKTCNSTPIGAKYFPNLSFRPRTPGEIQPELSLPAEDHLGHAKTHTRTQTDTHGPSARSHTDSPSLPRVLCTSCRRRCIAASLRAAEVGARCQQAAAAAAAASGGGGGGGKRRRRHLEQLRRHHLCLVARLARLRQVSISAFQHFSSGIRHLDAGQPPTK